MGESESQVLARLGPPRRVHHYVSSGQHLHTLRYANPAINVSIVDERGGPFYKRAIGIWTYSRSERTPEGAGVGDTRARLKQLLPSIDCTAIPTACAFVDIKRQRGTAFYFSHGHVRWVFVFGVS